MTELLVLANQAKSDPVTAILEAARQCYVDIGIAATGMREVADRASVARSTVYRYFPGRDDLLVATIKKEMELVNDLIREKLGGYDNPADTVVEGLILAIKEIPRRPLLAAVFASEEGSRARRVVWSSDVIVRFGEELMDHVIRPSQDAGLLQDAVRPEVLVEWVYRFLLSFLTLPSNWVSSDEELRTTLHALLVPVLLKPAAL
ncbi:MAG: TetR/AcrR family transcriptional regulator [Bacteroidia bacterium]|jgi:TetR/AcrR family transcriptional regulator